MPVSPFRKLAPYAELAHKQGKIVYPLNIGQPDIETPPAALAAVRNADIRVLGYSHGAGTEATAAGWRLTTSGPACRW
jgi:aspartate aminotransferase